MNVSISLKWKGNMAFDAEVDGHIITLDASVDNGGADTGASPKKLLLVALAGCTGMDVVSKLKKMRVVMENFTVDVESSQTENEHPYVYEYYKIVYNFEGDGLEAEKEKIQKAVSLSQDKYCGVSSMLSKSAPVCYEIKINSKAVKIE